jgi:hypothetical protein
LSTFGLRTGNLPFRDETVHEKSWLKRSAKLSKSSLLLTRPSITKVASSFTRSSSSWTCPTITYTMVVGTRPVAHIETLRVPCFEVLIGRDNSGCGTPCLGCETRTLRAHGVILFPFYQLHNFLSSSPCVSHETVPHEITDEGLIPREGTPAGTTLI